MTTTTVPTFTATIWCGYSGKDERAVGDWRAADVCRGYCDRVGLCVSFTETQFIYTDGTEYGCVVGLINYPRFPSTPAELKAKALELAALLKDAMKQKRVTVVFPDETVMLGEIERPA